MGILDQDQIKAVKKMHDGCILCAKVGAGKTRVSLSYYINFHREKKLYVITTARKRDSKDWEDEYTMFDEWSIHKDICVDSWQNICKYSDVKDSFFIFDEQRVVGYGAWTKAFLKITKSNKWVLLSATPGDNWSDYAPVFIANGFYRNITDFRNQHCIYSAHTSFPKIERYVDQGLLMKHKNDILVKIEKDVRPTVEKHRDVICSYNKFEYGFIMKEKFDKDKGEPFKNVAQICYALRKVVNSDPSRMLALLQIVENKKRVIVFYNYDYELEILKKIPYPLDTIQAEWNGHKHQPVPDSPQWVYFVQYAAGAEAWNCITTDTMVFYSNNYSYKVMTQAAGRINRRNTPYVNLYYYHLKSKAPIDMAIDRALSKKKKFNEHDFAGGLLQ